MSVYLACDEERRGSAQLQLRLGDPLDAREVDVDELHAGVLEGEVFIHNYA